MAAALLLVPTDAYPEPGTPLADWEEKLYLANDTARCSLRAWHCARMRCSSTI